MKKILISVIGVMLIALLTVGVTYSFFLTSASGNASKVAGNSAGYDIVFTKVRDLSGEIEPTSQRSNDMYANVKIRVTNTSALVAANLYIDIEEISSEIATSALKWELVGTKSGNSITLNPSSGDFASCNHSGTLGACQDGDRLYILKNYVLDTVDSDFVLYIWLDGNMIFDDVSDAVFNASVGADNVNFTGVLIPPEYQRVEFIQSHDDVNSTPTKASQYIATNITPTNTTGVYARLKSNKINADLLYFGAASTSGNKWYAGNISSKVYFGWNSSDTPTASRPSTDSSSVHTIQLNYLNDRKHKYDNTTVSSDLATLNTINQTMAIFGWHNSSGGYSANALMQLYELRVSVGSNIVAYFIPCYRRSDGEIGLYDIIESNGAGDNSFYSNGSGVGAFTTGPEVN